MLVFTTCVVGSEPLCHRDPSLDIVPEDGKVSPHATPIVFVDLQEGSIL